VLSQNEESDSEINNDSSDNADNKDLRSVEALNLVVCDLEDSFMGVLTLLLDDIDKSHYDTGHSTPNGFHTESESERKLGHRD